ncbi:MAG: hypothetical protein AMXMBFR84_08420 [Candidatus Hydrogenedentota bacterium]
MLLKDLGQRIRGQREKRGLKQQDIANALNVSPQAVSKWERGENAPDITILSGLARLLGVTTDWLLGSNAEGKDVFEATVLATSVDGAYKRSLEMQPRDFALWANALFYQLTELILRHDGVPVKYMGDRSLSFFSGPDHRRRAVDAAMKARSQIGSTLRIGLHSGPIYLGSVGHPDYARPDIMGEVVNVAFLTMEWAERETKSGIAATAAALEGFDEPPAGGKDKNVKFLGLERPVSVREIKAS